MIRLLLADDQDLIRRGLRALLKTDPELMVVGEAENGALAHQQCQALAPDVVLMDVRMPVMDGVAATRLIRQEFPLVRVLILTTFADQTYVEQGIRAGASGYLLKDTPFEELTQAIRFIHRGYTQIGPGLLECVLESPRHPQAPPQPGWEELTDRDHQIIQLIAQGMSNREIAQTLFLSEKTVKNRLTQILSCLNLRDRTQLAVSVWQKREP
ncbi:MAG: response regulator transcription factor [Oscillatoriales cyanobacterium SM2_2_1]|nr:response regulator transcription factor [Oscillatoriales cyanobacterium SM2_2_1]